jgi:hypothetical protein
LFTPAWRARLRDLLLPREIVEMPARLAELIELNRAALERLDRIEDEVGQLRGDVTALKGSVALLHSDNSVLKGSGMEQRYRQFPRFFAHLISEPIALAPAELDAWLQEQAAIGRLTQAEALRILRTDIVFRGVQDGQAAHLLVEVSWTVDETDVQRAADRARLLRKAAPLTRPVVAGQRIQPDAVALAERLDVARVIEEELDVLEDDAATRPAAI